LAKDKIVQAVILPHVAKIDSAFKLSECKQESGCKFLMSSGAGAGVTF